MSASDKHLSPRERHERILAMLRREGSVRIATLAKSFGVTTETARRDLDELAQGGALKRTYGGGAMPSLIDEPGIGFRTQVRAAERARIAAAAAERVEPGDALMIDSGSTTSLFANALAARNLHLTVVTNCLPVAASLGSGERCRVILCPGEFNLRESGVFGADTLAFIARFKADKAFIGAGGVNVDGVSDADSAGCAVKRAMMGQSKQTLLLLDSAKFGRSLFERLCAWSAVDTLVTDAAPPRSLDASLRAARVELEIASG